VKTLAMALIILMEKLAETFKQISTHSNSKPKSKQIKLMFAKKKLKIFLKNVRILNVA